MVFTWRVDTFGNLGFRSRSRREGLENRSELYGFMRIAEDLTTKRSVGSGISRGVRVTFQSMIAKRLLLILIAAFPFPSMGEVSGASLFLYPEEVVAILESRRSSDTLDSSWDKTNEGAQTEPNLPKYLHLSAVLVDGDGQYEVWLNGRRHEPESRTWSLVEVRGDRVRLRLSKGDLAGRVIEIGVNQTLDLKSGKLVEGRSIGLREPIRISPRRVP